MKNSRPLPLGSTIQRSQTGVGLGPYKHERKYSRPFSPWVKGRRAAQSGAATGPGPHRGRRTIARRGLTSQIPRSHRLPACVSSNRTISSVVFRKINSTFQAPPPYDSYPRHLRYGAAGETGGLPEGPPPPPGPQGRRRCHPSSSCATARRGRPEAYPKGRPYTVKKVTPHPLR